MIDPQSMAVVEPRLRNLAKEISRILSLVEFEKDGKPVQVDGFRLRDLSQWQDHEAESALDALLPISGLCNSNCAFCFEQEIPFVRERSFMSLSEVRTRLRHYSPESGRALFASTRPEMETFLHPQGLEILEMARQKDPGKIFCITTNGSRLDEATVERLEGLRPLILKLSLNVADEAEHRRLMRLGKGTEVALAAPERLRRHAIPFIGGIVAWPTLSLETIEQTVRYLESHDAYAIRVRLPLAHRWMREPAGCDLGHHWSRVAEYVRGLRCRVPLYVEPAIYSTPSIVPLVDGVVLNSPAYRSGVLPGDRVDEINGQPVATRNESHAVLQQCQDTGCEVDLTVDRQDRKLSFRLQAENEADYPYDPALPYRGQAYGIFHVHDFRVGLIYEVFEKIEQYGARRVLLFSSPLVAPVFDALTENIPEFAQKRKAMTLYVDTVPSSVLGGNFRLLDGRFVDEFAAAIRNRLAKDPALELILIPNAFGSAWGVDLGGASYSRLVLEFGIPIELIDWHFVYGRDD
jgi:uncharacterized Fe-S cluster-containing radical SAM superfamily protein